LEALQSKHSSLKNISFVSYIKDRLAVDHRCENFHQLPDIHILLKSRKSYLDKRTIVSQITLKPEDYIINGKNIKRNIESTYTKNEYFEKINDNFNPLSCLPAFMPLDVPEPRGPLFIFGEYFLKKFYTVFDRDQNVLGFSVSNHGSSKHQKNLSISTPYDNDEDSLNINGNKKIMEKNFDQKENLISFKNKQKSSLNNMQEKRGTDDYLLRHP
jgi:hypothetical protein